MSVHSFFIAGTDTDVGKTFIATGLLACAREKGLSTAGYKPVSAGCAKTADGLRNEDAEALLAGSSLELEYSQVNPIAFADPVAPHLAASREGQSISLDEITVGYQVLRDKAPDFLLVEGAGGWRLPLNNQGLFLSEFAVSQQLPVILVIGMKLGCLNHAMLTIEAIQRDGLAIAGWVANHIDTDMLYQKDNLETLKALIDAPCLGVVPKLAEHHQPSEFLDITPLQQFS